MGLGFSERIAENLLVNRIPKLAFLCKPFNGAVIFDIIVYFKVRGFIHLEI